jgi:hypothetical protein
MSIKAQKRSNVVTTLCFARAARNEGVVCAVFWLRYLCELPFRVLHIHARELQEVFAQDLAFRRLRKVRVAVAYPQGPAAFRSPSRHRGPMAGTKWGFRSRRGSFPNWTRATTTLWEWSGNRCSPWAAEESAPLELPTIRRSYADDVARPRACDARYFSL